MWASRRRLVQVAGVGIGLAVALPAYGKKASEATSDATYNVDFTLPGGLSAERLVSTNWSVGIYAERGGGFGGGGGGRGGNGSTADHTESSTSDYGFQAHWTPLAHAYTDAFFLEPYLGYINAKFKSSATGYSTTGAGVTGGLIAGYGWFWDTGINLQLGLGIKDTEMHVGNTAYTALDGSPANLKTGRDHGFGGTGEVAVGFAF